MTAFYSTILMDRLDRYALDLRLTHEERGFVINYDIKYRMGAGGLDDEP